MTIAQIIVTISGLALSALVLWYFLFSQATGTQVAAGTGGVQEVQIIVKGGYTPDVLVVKAGQPVRFNFLRQETASCSEMVLFLDFNKSARLPPGETVSVEFTPDTPGEYEFQCQMGMLRGKLVVE
jgi:plastocyanin domain-containing protein